MAAPTKAAPKAIRDRIVGYEQVAPDQLLANPGNFRRHPAEQLEALRGSLDTLGWVKPVLVNTTTGHVVDGHARIEEALAREAPTIPVLYLELTEEEERIALASLDPISALAAEDDEALRALLKDIDVPDPRLAAFLDGLIPDEKEPFNENLQGLEPPPKPITQPGDLIVMGAHRLICGDSQDPTVYDRLLAGATAQCLWTDPPYNVAYAGSPGAPRREIANDDQSPEDFRAFLGTVLDLALARMDRGAAVYVAAPTGPQFLDFGLVLRPRGVWRQTLIWDKQMHALGRSDYHYRHEVIFEGNVPLAPFEPDDADLVAYGWKPGGPHRWHGGRSRNTVFEVPKPKTSAAHPTMKPIALIRPMIEASTLPGQRVLDPFAGSGSTMIACEESGRSALLIELDPAYCDVIAQRYEAATGLAAVRHRTP